VDVETQGYDEERLGRILRRLKAAPEAWVQAAVELAPARIALDEIVRRAEEDAAYRERIVADLEAALAAEGVEPTTPVVDALRARLDASTS
jgi:hypothetical protein